MSLSDFLENISVLTAYIFEDCDEKHVTNNTYEWCADGIVPEIHELQNVDMDIIKMEYSL